MTMNVGAATPLLEICRDNNQELQRIIVELDRLVDIGALQPNAWVERTMFPARRQETDLLRIIFAELGRNRRNTDFGNVIYDEDEERGYSTMFACEQSYFTDGKKRIPCRYQLHYWINGENGGKTVRLDVPSSYRDASPQIVDWFTGWSQRFLHDENVIPNEVYI